jgi:hypothetical protein
MSPATVSLGDGVPDHPQGAFSTDCLGGAPLLTEERRTVSGV